MTFDRSRPSLLFLTSLAALAPTQAIASSQLDLNMVFGDASPFIKLLMVALVLAAVAALALTGLKLAGGRRLAGGSSFVSALRLGGPLVGLLGAVLNLINIFIGIANARAEVPLTVLSPGFAEASLIFFLGLMAGVVAVICHWIIEARIDRTVLSS